MVIKQAQNRTTTSGIPAGAFVNPAQLSLMPIFIGIHPWSYANDDMDVVVQKFLENQQYEEGEI